MILSVIIDRNKFPECIRQYKEVRGIVLGGCIYDIEQKPYEAGREIAHAHTGWQVHRGYICSQYGHILYDKEVLLHETAHILTNQGHTKQWKKKCLEIGGILGRGSTPYDGDYPMSYHNICEKTIREKVSDFLTKQSGALITSFKHFER